MPYYDNSQAVLRPRQRLALCVAQWRFTLRIFFASGGTSGDYRSPGDGSSPCIGVSPRVHCFASPGGCTSCFGAAPLPGVTLRPPSLFAPSARDGASPHLATARAHLRRRRHCQAAACLPCRAAECFASLTFGGGTSASRTGASAKRTG